MTATSTHVGRFRFAAATDRWWWSDHMFLIHGMQPGDVVPTRELLLTHVRRDDRAVVAEALDRCVDGARPAGGASTASWTCRASPHRVVLAVAGDGDGEVTGFLVDVTAAHDALLAERVNTELALALESHAAIDQAKGILMLIYGVDEDAAFGILKQSSQRHNIRLRELAGRVVARRGRRAGVDRRASWLDEALCAVFAPDACRRGRAPPAARPARRARAPTGRSCACPARVDLSNRDELADAITLAMLRRRGRRARSPSTCVVWAGSAPPRRRADGGAAPSAAHGITMTIVGGGPGDAAVPARCTGRRSPLAADPTRHRRVRGIVTRPCPWPCARPGREASC